MTINAKALKLAEADAQATRAEADAARGQVQAFKSGAQAAKTEAARLHDEVASAECEPRADVHSGGHLPAPSVLFARPALRGHFEGGSALGRPVHDCQRREGRSPHSTHGQRRLP